MSMGYDDDDPRRARMLRGLERGDFKLKAGERPNVHASKFRAGAMPSRFGCKGMKP